jgi:adenylosuccinate lyase
MGRATSAVPRCPFTEGRESDDDPSFEEVVIPRYTPVDMAELWSPARRFAIWLEVELAACESLEEAGLVPRGTAASLRGKNLALSADRIEEIERTTKHDVIAFLTHVEELGGSDARWLHRGMTSSDVLDTSLAILLRDAARSLVARTEKLLAALARRAREHAKTPMIGRSHGIFAEPITFGLALAGHHAEIRRGRARLRTALEEIAVGKISGAVGTYAHLSPAIEQRALGALGLGAETVATQVVARDRHAAYFAALGVVAASIERLATNVRHWQRSDVAEAEEAFTPGQKGSSAMPHKRNPIVSENLCGLARVVRAAVTPALEDVALWHERDISHSSVERMLAPDATATLAFMLDRAASLVDGLVVYPERMRQNLDRAAELYFSEAVLLALVEAGVGRQEAYVVVQRNAMRAWHGEGRFRDLLSRDSEVGSRLSEKKLDALFDLEHALAHVPTILERALVPI